MAVIPKFLEGAAFGVLNDILSQFRSAEGGYANPNRYEVVLHPPSPSRGGSESQNHSRDQVQGVSAREVSTISMRCSSITLPGRTLSTDDDTNINGPRRQVASGVQFSDTVEMAFQSSSDAQERVMFEKWQYAAFNPQTFNMGYYNNYTGRVDIYLLNKEMTRTYGIKLLEAFPSILGDVSLDYGASNTIINWGVSMNFRYWESLDINQQAPSMADRIGQTITNVVERNIQRAIPSVLNRL